MSRDSEAKEKVRRMGKKLHENILLNCGIFSTVVQICLRTSKCSMTPSDTTSMTIKNPLQFIENFELHTPDIWTRIKQGEVDRYEFDRLWPAAAPSGSLSLSMVRYMLYPSDQDKVSSLPWALFLGSWGEHRRYYGLWNIYAHGFCNARGRSFWWAEDNL